MSVLKFEAIARALRDGYGLTVVARRFGVSRLMVVRAAGVYGVDLALVRAAEEAERKAAQSAKAAAAKAAREEREAARAERKAARAAASRAERKAAREEREAARAAASRAEREAARDKREAAARAAAETREKMISQAVELRAAGHSLRSIGASLGVSYETVRQMITRKIPEASKDKE